ncbi:abscission/NoCut checkpoint regulator-like [Achroia grisella]|uniref:abscission/NoCut checkpoint regulator-like n=1 Tax=Achroia grisella TaxID=688607 RepID=UPI0027D21046|nr:abscission/NoCut checkpoint regulator-like [Achroia grisella]
MACNSCAKPFTLFRNEKGCPNCGFAFCSKCLAHKMFVQKLNAETKVCMKCAKAPNSSKPRNVEPPDAYFKRITPGTNLNDNPTAGNSKDQEIVERLNKLKQDKTEHNLKPDEKIAKRLQGLTREVPPTTDHELQLRLANLRGLPLNVYQSKISLPPPDQRTEQEQTDDLLKQYIEQTKIDSTYKDEFDTLVNEMEVRLQRVKSGNCIKPSGSQEQQASKTEDEEDAVKKIVEKMKAEAVLEDQEVSSPRNDELPFCEICNEDANMRCLGCRYLFCKHCFIDHKDDDDGCNKYELYVPPKDYQ